MPVTVNVSAHSALVHVFLYQQKAAGFTETSVTEISESSEETQQHECVSVGVIQAPE